MTYRPRWLREWRESERAVKAMIKADQRWQAWCPYCERDTEHAHSSPGSDKDADVKCVRCNRLHSGSARGPQSN